MSKIVIVGDSLTQGIPGVSYWRYLRHNLTILNCGLGGDTLLGAKKRVRKMLNCKHYNVYDTYLLEIGTNDVFLPVLRQHSLWWRVVVWLKGVGLGSVPCKDLEQFKANYDELLEMLKNENKRVGIIGLPIIENTILKLNDEVTQYDQVIRDLSEKNEIPYIDLRGLEIQIKQENAGSYSFGKSTLGNMVDTIFTSFLPFSMLVSKLRGLAVTVDSIHLNSYTARELAKKVEKEFIHKEDM